MYFYRAYGLSFRSEMYLPELCSGGDGKDVIISFNHFETIKNTKEINIFSGFKVFLSENDIYIFVDEIPLCKISGGSQILINPRTKLDESYIRVVVLGSAMSYLLHQRGHLVLHASAVNINNGVIAFLGGNGAGKSTISFSLYKKGYSLITDDLLSVNITDSDITTVNPGSKLIKLLPGIIGQLNENFNLMPKTHRYSTKHSYLADENFSYDPIPLKKIYILHPNEKWALSSLKPSETLMKLVKSSHPHRLFTKHERGQNLIQCSKLLEEVEVKFLEFEHSLDKLPDLIQLIEHDSN